MKQDNTSQINIEELLRKARPAIRTIGTVVGVALTAGEKIQARISSAVKSLTLEKQLLARYDKLISMGLTEEQATATLKQVLENMLAKERSANQQEEQGGTK